MRRKENVKYSEKHDGDRTGPNPQAIDEIFRGAALYRDKWERSDYRESTIDAGIEACHDTFHKSRMEHPPFIKFDDNTGAPNVSVPLLAKYVCEHLCYVLVRDNGKQGLLKYVYENGCYRLYADNILMGIIKVTGQAKKRRHRCLTGICTRPQTAIKPSRSRVQSPI